MKIHHSNYHQMAHCKYSLLGIFGSVNSDKCISFNIEPMRARLIHTCQGGYQGYQESKLGSRETSILCICYRLVINKLNIPINCGRGLKRECVGETLCLPSENADYAQFVASRANTTRVDAPFGETRSPL